VLTRESKHQRICKPSSYYLGDDNEEKGLHAMV